MPKLDLISFELSWREQQILNTITANPGGVKPVDLIRAMYRTQEKIPPSAYGMLRVKIHEINQRIKKHGFYIKGARSVGYRLRPIIGEEK